MKNAANTAKEKKLLSNTLISKSTSYIFLNFGYAILKIFYVNISGYVINDSIMLRISYILRSNDTNILSSYPKIHHILIPAGVGNY